MRPRDACDGPTNGSCAELDSEPRFSVDSSLLATLWPLVSDERLSLEERVALTISLAELDAQISDRSD